MSGAVTIESGNAGGGDTNATGAAKASGIEIDPHGGPDDLAAIAAAKEAVARAERERDAALAQQMSARSETAQARDQLARERQISVESHRAVAAQAIEAADAQMKRARDALRVAHDTGDSESLAAATEELASARYRKEQASAELQRLGQARQQQPAQNGGGQQQANVWTPGPRAREWLAAHPRMESDQEYAQTAAMADAQARRRGYAPESDEYFRHVNQVMDGVYGAGHAGGAGGGQEPMSGQSRDNRGGNGDRTSVAAPSHRGGGTQNGGWKDIQTGLGILRVQESGGKMKVAFGDDSTRENMEEGAKVCFPGEYAKDPSDAIRQYVEAQIAIFRDQEAGRATGHVPMGEGRTYR